MKNKTKHSNMAIVALSDWQVFFDLVCSLNSVEWHVFRDISERRQRQTPKCRLGGFSAVSFMLQLFLNSHFAISLQLAPFVDLNNPSSPLPRHLRTGLVCLCCWYLMLGELPTTFFIFSLSKAELHKAA